MFAEAREGIPLNKQAFYRKERHLVGQDQKGRRVYHNIKL
jgi:hypothetical protein